MNRKVDHKIILAKKKLRKLSQNYKQNFINIENYIKKEINEIKRSNKLSNNIIKALKDRTACLIANHGQITYGSSLDEAFELAEEIENISKHENEVLTYGEEILRKNNSVKLIGNPKNKGGVLSFTVDGIHPHDIATILDEDGVAIRAGHHCCQILHEKLGLSATARASFGVYNNKDDIDLLNESLNKCKKIFNLK